MENLKKLGRILNKQEQKVINGGCVRFCNTDDDCNNEFTLEFERCESNACVRG